MSEASMTTLVSLTTVHAVAMGLIEDIRSEQRLLYEEGDEEGVRMCLAEYDGVVRLAERLGVRRETLPW